MIASVSPGLIPWTLPAALLLLAGAILAFAVRIVRGAKVEATSEPEPTQRSTPDVEAGRYLPPRDCQVLIAVDGEEAWADVEFTRVGAAYGWHFADSGKELDPELVVDWREVPLRGAAS
jgi:hypothetical protein